MLSVWAGLTAVYARLARVNVDAYMVYAKVAQRRPEALLRMLELPVLARQFAVNT